ncbi:response regulator transcription factor [Rothia sp. ARF10]|nr:response regulator transcription factor [Rothia sp. ARF10]
MTEAPRRPVTVAVINDHELIVRGVAAMLEPFADLVEIVELDADLPVSQPVDVALYDAFTRTSLGGDDLDELVDNPNVGRVVLYTWALTPELIATARSRGVHAAIPKGLGADRLAEAITSAHEGRMDVIPVTTHPPVDSPSWPGREQGLTPREAEIIALVASGLSNNDIAERTYLSINSVKSYIRSAYRTMGVTSRSQAVLWGIDHGMTPTRMRIALRDGADPEEGPADLTG